METKEETGVERALRIREEFIKTNRDKTQVETLQINVTSKRMRFIEALIIEDEKWATSVSEKIKMPHTELTKEEFCASLLQGALDEFIGQYLLDNKIDPTGKTDEEVIEEIKNLAPVAQ